MSCGGCAAARARREKQAAERAARAAARKGTEQPSGGRRVPQPSAGPSGRGGYTLTAPDGTTQEFGSRLEGEAERIRRGGGTLTPND